MLRFSLPALLLLSLHASAAPIRYNRDIRPILSDNCFHCHGPDANHRKGDLRLDIGDDAITPAKSGKPAIVPGDPAASELVARLSHSDPDELMPPPDSHKTLSPAQKATLTQWIAEGAPYEAHWAYSPITRPPVPTINDPRASIRNPIDAFIQAPLLARNIAPSPEAAPNVLARRLSLDLTGLPAPTPTPASLETFTDHLLASPQYGERMAQHWLDVVRYADTVGFHGDQNHNAWPYRDWVIDAFNQNLPFDQFTRAQLAGDLLPNPGDREWTASCFNRLTMMTREGGAQPREYLAKYTADRVRTVSMAWLGATVGCAECHDHKFDPWTQKDFYSLGAFFADVRQWGVYNDYAYTPNPDLRGWSNDHPFPPERSVISPALVARRDRLVAARSALGTESLAADQQPAFAAWQASATQFLAAHPDGWSSTPPSVTLAKTAAPAIQPDGRIVFPKSKPAPTEISLPATNPTEISAIRIEILPDGSHGNSISRGGPVTLKPSFTRIDATGKASPLTIRAAEANRRKPRYANGFEITSITSGWTSDPANTSLAHSSTWLLANPLSLKPGESLRVSLPDHSAAALRVSTSPIISNFHQSPPAADAASFIALHQSALAKPILALDDQITATRNGYTQVMVTERAPNPLTIRVLARGNWQDESGPVAPPLTPGFLPQPDKQGPLSRLDLANWIVSPQNPLTARVVMNRLWRQLFGTGLSAQTDDLGAQGEAPSHPELLDWLAAEFMSDWDFRKMVRLIVSSHSYRQSSQPNPASREADPLNRWLASQNPRRLEAEAVRDNALAIAGLLDLSPGGPPVKPYQPAGYYAGLQFPDRDYIPDKGPDQYRRGIYSHWQRTFLHPMLANFDAPSREDCVALRTASNTPQQALTLLNDPSFVEAARVWASRLLPAANNDADRILRAFSESLGRPPTPEELRGLLDFLNAARKAYTERPEDIPRLLAIGNSPPPKDASPELAAWSSLCRVILNLHETITRY